MDVFNYDPEDKVDVQNDKYPLNLHLIFETTTALYWVDSSNAKVLLKTTDNGATVTTVTTRTNKDIARTYHDRDNNIIYFADCDYDSTTSYIWSLNTITDSINEITSIPDADVFDIWIYDGDLWYYYFGSGGYLLETNTIDPNGDGSTLEWNSTDTTHYTEVDEGATPNTADYLDSETLNDDDILTFPNGMDLSGYDYYTNENPATQIYEIVVKLYGKGESVEVDGNLTGMIAKTVNFDDYHNYSWKTATFSGLALEDVDIDDLEITLTNINTVKQGPDLYASHSISETTNPRAICWDESNYRVPNYLSGTSVHRYNSSWTYIDYDTAIVSTCKGLFYYAPTTDDFFAVTSNGKIYTYDSYFNYIKQQALSYDNASGCYWDASTTDVWILHPDEPRVAKYHYSIYTNTFSYTTSWLISDTTDATGIAFDGTSFWIVDDDGTLYEYNTSFVLQNTYFLPDVQGAGDMYYDGTYLNVISEAKEMVYQYDLTSINNVSTIFVATVRVDVNFYGDELTDLVMKNHTDAISSSNTMGSIGVRTWKSSQIVNIDDQFWFLWKWSDENVELWRYDISLDNFVEMEDCGSNTELPDNDSQWGISYDNDDTLFFILKDTSDTYNYLYTYGITGDDLTKGPQYNIALMLNRNTDSGTDPPFNLEKAYDITYRHVYQISENRGHLYKIADLSTLAIDGTIVGITDSYLFVKRTSNDIELWKLEDIKDHFISAEFVHIERDLSVARIKYDNEYYNIKEDMFLQIIGNMVVNGSLQEDVVVFEGYAEKPKDLNKDSGKVKIVDIVSRARFDLEKSFNGSLSGDSDDYLTTIVADMDYISKGTFTAGQALQSISYNSGKKCSNLMNQVTLGDELTWRLRPDGTCDSLDGTDASGVSYNESDSPRLHAVIQSEKDIRPNKVIVKGAYVDGVQIISSPAEDEANQAANGPITLTKNIAWITTTALANIYAQAILNLVGASRTEIEFRVRDTTNGFVLPIETINIAYAPLNISAANYIVHKVHVDVLTDHFTYLVSSSQIWEEKDLGGDYQQELGDNVEQIGSDVSDVISDVAGLISDDAYASGWNGVTDVAPSKNAVYDTLAAHYADPEAHQTDVAFIHIQHCESSGVNGGTLTAWTWLKRPITHLRKDTHSICSINTSDDTFTIPAGTYIIDISAQAYDCKSHHLRLYNTTDSSVEALGQVGYLETTDNCGASSVLRHVLTIASTKSFRVEQESSATKAAIGMGFAQAGFGDDEIYMDIFIWKIA